MTDPPYELGFQNQHWDKQGVSYNPATWKEVLRVLKPGAHMLCFGGTRTYHRIAVAIEDAGFEIRDCLSWIYSSGMPKSHNLKGDFAGRGTALKPSWEPIILARKPLGERTVLRNVQTYGTGTLNIEQSRIPTTDKYVINTFDDGAKPFGNGAGHEYTTNAQPVGGRWPANVVGDEEALGEAARFFFCSKANNKEKDAGLTEPNLHPTVKPIDLMTYLVKLITPKGGTVLDPFMGTGSTGCAIVQMDDIGFTGIDLDAHNVTVSQNRMLYWQEVYNATT